MYEPKLKYKPESFYKSDINDLVEEELEKGGPGSGIKGHRTPKKGEKVKVSLSSGHHHVGEYLGEDKVFENVHYVGVLETTSRPHLKPKDGKKYISVFRGRLKDLSPYDKKD